MGSSFIENNLSIDFRGTQWGPIQGLIGLLLQKESQRKNLICLIVWVSAYFQHHLNRKSICHSMIDF